MAKHALTYPSMQSGMVRLRMATDAEQIKPLRDELTNDFEARGNLSPDWFNFLAVDDSNWTKETWLIYWGVDLIGYIELKFFNNRQQFSLGVGITKEHRDRGIGIKALLLITRYAFEVLGMHKLEIAVFAYNTRLIKIYDTILVKEGVRRDSDYWCGRWWNRHLYGLTSYDYMGAKPKVDFILRERAK